MLYITLCDDEPVQLSLLENYVKEWGQGRRHEMDIRLCSSAEQFLFHWEEKQEIDILLLDISMPGMDGISLAHKLRKRGDHVQIVFVTGLADYALEGYDVDAVSYLLKPVKKEQLFNCLDRARDRRGKGDAVLLLETPGGMAREKFKNICYLESAAHDTEVHSIHGGEPFRCKQGIRQLEEHVLQSGQPFFKIHRSYLVNLAFVNRITRRDVVMDTGEKLPVARNRWEALNQAYLEYYRGKQELS